MPGLGRLYAAVLGQAVGLNRGGGPLGDDLADQTGHNLAGRVAGELDVTTSGVMIETAHLARYLRVCGFRDDAAIPATYPHVVAFPLHLWLMTRRAFPFPPMGVVHIANTITQRRQFSTDEVLSLRAYAEPVRPHRRGRQITLVTEVWGERLDDDLPSDQSAVWVGRTQLLRREPRPVGSQHSSRSGGEGDSETIRTPTGPVEWRVGGSLGRTYARATGDVNPIHLTDLTAIPLGFRRHIAHGMWTHARVLAELDNRLPSAIEVSVDFKRPLTLPGRVRFGARDDGTRIDVGVTSGPMSEPVPHLVGSITRLSGRQLSAADPERANPVES